MKARLRPHFQQRFNWRLGNFGFLLARAITDFLAILFFFFLKRHAQRLKKG